MIIAHTLKYKIKGMNNCRLEINLCAMEKWYEDNGRGDAVWCGQYGIHIVPIFKFYMEGMLAFIEGGFGNDCNIEYAAGVIPTRIIEKIRMWGNPDVDSWDFIREGKEND